MVVVYSGFYNEVMTFLDSVFNPKTIKGDLFGGIIAAVVALPLALAFGVSSGAGAIAGVYGAIACGFFAALFGGTSSQVSGPTGPMTIVMAAVVTDYIAKFPETGLALAFTVVMLGGLFQILFGFLKLGRYVSMVPYAVISGFMSGIGLIIILLQIPPLLGHEVSGGLMPVLKALPDILRAPHYMEIVIGLTAVALIYTWPKALKAYIPASLVALVVFSVAIAVFFADANIAVLGDIPVGLPQFHMPVFEASLIFSMLKSAIILALLGSIDSLLTSLVADNMTHSYHDPEKELIGQGIGNIVAGLIGGIPGAGATMRTVVNVQNGGQTRLSGMCHAALLLFCILGAGHYVSFIPLTVLAAILVAVGVDIIDWSFIRRIPRFPRRITVTMFTVMLLTVFVDLITAVIVGIVMSSLSTVKRMADLQIKMTREITRENAREHLSEEDAALLEKGAGVFLLYQLHGPLSFGAAKHMLKTLSADRDYKILVLDMTYVPMVDVTTSLTIEDIIRRVRAKGKDVRFVGLQPEVQAQFHLISVASGEDDEGLETLQYGVLADALRGN